MSDVSANLSRLIHGCRKDDRNCQRGLFEHFFGYAMNICLRYTANREEAEEVLNNAFLKVFRNLDKYDPDQPFRPWLRRVLINSAVDYYRSNCRRPVHLELLAADDKTDDSPLLPFIFPEDDCLPVLRQLTPAYRMVFNLYVMEEYSHEEIALLLGISAGASRSNLARAKEKLREILTPQPSNGLNTV